MPGAIPSAHMRRHQRITRTTGLLGILLASGALSAQPAGQVDAAPSGLSPGDDEPSILADTARDQQRGADPLAPRFSFESGGLYAFESDVDEGGKVSRAEIFSRIGVDIPINRMTGVGFSVGAKATIYDFSDMAFGSSGGPLDEAGALSFDASIRHAFNADWALFAGAGVRFSAEPDALFDDSATYRGFAALSYQALPWLRIGAGGLISTRLEDSALVIPIVLVEAKLGERWTLSNTTGGAGSVLRFGAGAVLRYQMNDTLSFSVEAGYERDQFRLDKDNDLSESGIFEDTGIPVFFAVRYVPTRNITLDAAVGTNFARELELQDSRGRRIMKSDVDPSLVVALGLNIRF